MKKLVAGALALALGFSAFAQEAGVHELTGSAGKISFGAWGRSTFNIGETTTKTKIEVTTKYNDDVLAGAAIQTNNALGSVLSNGTSAVLAAANSAGYSNDTIKKGIDDQVIPVLAAKGVKETDDTDTEWYASVAPDWSYGCRVGFWIIGRTNDERWGFDFNLDSDAAALFVGAQNYDGKDPYGNNAKNMKQKNGGISYAESGKYAVAIGDQAKIWGIFDFNPIDLKVAFGKMREQELRGSIGDFGQRESADVRSEDDIFTEMWPVMGMFVSAKGQKGTALEGLYAAVDCDAFGLVSSASESDKELKTKLSDLASTLQGGLGYTIPGLAQVKAQFIADSIEESNKKYSKEKYQLARDAGMGYDSYAGRFEFGIDWLGFAGGATGLGDVDLDKTPNANLIELGVKVPLVIDEDLRQYDPEKFYNFYACLGTMGVIQKGFILYKAHVWGGKGKSNLSAYTDITNSGSGLLDYTGNAANIVMAGFDALTEVCLNPFGAQNNFAGLSFNYNITLADADGKCKIGGETQTVNDLKMSQHKFGVEVYLKHTFAANNYFFIGVADRLTIAKMDGTLDISSSFETMKTMLNLNPKASADLSYTAITNKVYIPVGVEMFF
ncbi:hypothetical protein [Treponema sp. C6A8]|uniref:hypothetical protein n=1 Tax=Treponema sp. C6A8 TaxID=1410609 RepID=UPI000489773F|nr:hypothetical protein [Treponema sp. C6A8]